MKTLIFLVLVCLLSVSPVFSGEESGSQVQKLCLPEGDQISGREVFLSLRCNSCHLVSGDKDMAKPDIHPNGPPLGLRQARYKPNFIADSIIFPSHAIMPGSKGKTAPGGFSRMGDFSDSITVRQLADLVAYLKSLDEEV